MVERRLSQAFNPIDLAQDIEFPLREAQRFENPLVGVSESQIQEFNFSFENGITTDFKAYNNLEFKEIPFYKEH
jgi:hypothetical protein